MYKHTFEGYRGITTVTCSKDPNIMHEVQYEIKLNKFEHLKVERIILAYCQKELSEYTEKLPHLIDHEDDEEHYKLTIRCPNGLQDINKSILPTLNEMDKFLHYVLMDTHSLGEHFKIIQAAIREQRQWHWLKEKPNYENLIFPE